MTPVPSLARLEELRRGLCPSNSIVEASRILLCLQARRLEQSVPEAVAGLHPGPVHDARVAGRRLRAGATLFRSMFPRTWKRAERAGRAVTSGFRQARDMDIRAARLRRMAIEARDRPAGLLAMVRKLQAETSALRAGAVRAAGPPPRAIPAPLMAELWRPRASRVHGAEREIGVRLRDLGQRARLLIPVAAVEGHCGVQHRLRIRCKAVRYSLEMMDWRLGPEAAGRLGTLRRVQDILGDMHDIDLFIAYVREGPGAGSGRPSGPAREMLAGLAGERRRHFQRFLDIRGKLDSALGPVSL